MNVLRLRALVVAGNLAHLPVAMRPLLIVLLGVHSTGSYLVAGLASGAAAAGLAVGAPFWTRMLTLRGHRPVLLGLGAAATALHLALAVPAAAPVFVAVAAASGLVTPPVTSSVRTQLPQHVPEAALTRTYAANSIALELVYVAGPLWVTGWTALTGPRGALVASAVVGGAATAATVALLPRSTARPLPAGGGSLLALPVLRTLAAVHLAYWTCMGAMWVLVPAFAARAGAPAAAGPLVAVWSLGSLVGGLLLAAGARRVRLPAAYLALLGGLAVASLPLALPATPAQMAVVITVFGLGLAPWLAVADELVAHAAPRARVAEAYGWLVTIGQVGCAAGSGLAGPLADRHGGGPAFLLVSAALFAGLGIAVLGRRALPPGHRRAVPVEAP
jgi:MFS family permease